MLSAETILQMNPDTRRAMALVAGLITCLTGAPKLSLISCSMIMLLKSLMMKKVLEVIREYFTSEYNIEATQFDKVERIISKQGAEIYAILPRLSGRRYYCNNHENATPRCTRNIEKK